MNKNSNQIGLSTGYVASSKLSLRASKTLFAFKILVKSGSVALFTHSNFFNILFINSGIPSRYDSGITLG